MLMSNIIEFSLRADYTYPIFEQLKNAIPRVFGCLLSFALVPLHAVGLYTDDGVLHTVRNGVSVLIFIYNFMKYIIAVACAQVRFH